MVVVVDVLIAALVVLLAVMTYVALRVGPEGAADGEVVVVVVVVTGYCSSRLRILARNWALSFRPENE